MSSISTHVLDTALGRPASGIPVTLSRCEDAGLSQLGSGMTDPEGRLNDLLPKGVGLDAGEYELRFDTSRYFAETKRTAFFPWVCVNFRVEGASAHYHVPLLLSPFGYSTYRGS